MVRNTQRRNLSKKIKKSYRNKKRNKSKKRLRRGGAEVPELPVEQMMVNAREMQTLEEENERLKAENERLKEENKGLKEENERLKAENKKQSNVVKLLTTDSTLWNVTKWKDMINKIIEDESLKDEDISDLKDSLDKFIPGSGSKEEMFKAFDELYPIPIARQVNHSNNSIPLANAWIID